MQAQATISRLQHECLLAEQRATSHTATLKSTQIEIKQLLARTATLESQLKCARPPQYLFFKLTGILVYFDPYLMYIMYIHEALCDTR